MAAPKNFSGKFGLLDGLSTLLIENFDKIALSRSVKEIEAMKAVNYIVLNAKFGEENCNTFPYNERKPNS